MNIEITAETYKSNDDEPDTTFLVFYREGQWGSRQRLMPVSWETTTLRGDDPRWKFWNKAAVREYIILARTENPKEDKEFQQLTALAGRIRRPDILRAFGVEWHQLDAITVGKVRAAVAPKRDAQGRVRAATSSPLLREALELIVSTPSVRLNARRLAAAVLGAGGSTRGLEVATRIAKLRLTPAEAREAAVEAVKSKRAEAAVIASHAA